MWFWWFMLGMCLMIPVMMIVFGACMLKKPDAMWYHSGRSIKSKEAGRYANLLCGKLWKKTGWVMLLPPVVLMLPMYGKEEDPIGIVSTAIIVLQTTVMIVTIILVEKGLRREFTKTGEPIDQIPVSEDDLLYMEALEGKGKTKKN